MADEPKKIEQVRFIYQKARHHRTFHADGAWAGITPQSEIQVAFFNDLKPMPDEVVHAVTEEGHLGVEISRKHDQEDVIREANVTVVMNKNSVRLLMALLDNMAKQIEAATEGTPPVTVLTEEKDNESSKVS